MAKKDNGTQGIDAFAQFEADTKLTMFDMAAELTAFTILWHTLECGNDPVDVIGKSKAHNLTVPFVFKIRDRLKADGRWPEGKDLEYSALLTSLLMVKAARMTPDQMRNLTETINDAVIAARIF